MEAYNLEFLRIAIALVGTAIAAWQDQRTSFIDDKILFGMAGAGALLTLATMSQAFIVNTFAVAAFIMIFGYLLYRQGQLGMGDVILFAALALLLPSQPALLKGAIPARYGLFELAAYSPLSAPLAVSLGILKNFLFFLTIFVVSSFAATIASGLFYAYRLSKTGKRLQPNMLAAAASLLALAVGGYFLVGAFGFTATTAAFLLLLLSSAFFLTFRDQILKEIVVKRIAIKDVEDEDILAVEMMDKTIVAKYGLGRVLTREMVKKLRAIEKNEGLKYFPVNKVLPRFGPY
ncbi:MAG: prepilin peptidase, partial [Candidatus Micrarchaeota archaeon]